MDFGGELLIHFTPNIALGLGAGYIQASKSSTLTFSGYGETANQTWAPKVSAIPITATLYYFLPSTGGVKLFLDAGVGYYLGKYTDKWHIVYYATYDETIDTTANGIGFHGGLGIEVPFSPAVSLIVEGRGRYASLGNFKGTVNNGLTTVTGNVWLMNSTVYGSAYPVLGISSSTPPSSLSPVQAKLDLSGFSAQIGFIFHL